MPCKPFAVLALAVALACGMGAVGASAQGGGVNDCTLLTDPTLLRQCVERARQGGNASASPSSSQDAFSPHRPGTAGATNSALTQGAGPAKTDARGRKTGKRDKVRPESRTETPRQGRIP